MYINSLACVRVKVGESACFRIESGVRQGCFMSPRLFNVYTGALMKEVKMWMGKMGVMFLEEEREWRLPGLLYSDDSVLCGKSEKALKVMLGRCM